MPRPATPACPPGSAPLVVARRERLFAARRRARSALALAGLALAALAATVPAPGAAAAVGATAPGAPGRAQPPARASLLAMQTTAPTGRIVIKLRADADLTVARDGLAVRAEPGREGAAGSGGAAGAGGMAGAGSAAAKARAASRAARLDALLAAVAPGARFERRFSRDAADLDRERRLAEARGGGGLPDLNLYAQVTPSAGAAGRAGLLAVVKALLADPAVETAFLEPVAVPAALGFDAFAERGAAAGAAAGAVASAGTSAGGFAAASASAGAGDLPTAEPAVTPDFTSLQGYLGAAPAGVNALAVAGNPGGTGAGVRVVDVEGAWLWSHEDLPVPVLTLGAQIDDLGWRNHGTAVLGEIAGVANGLGVRGIAPGCQVGASSIGSQSTADAISNATAQLAAGDIILIELHAPGPNATGSGQVGYVPMEFWQDNFDAIRLATAAGLIVCEAAGNGQEDLDDPVYLGLFDRAVRDSGAIMCGASSGSSLNPAWFTNHGTRVDLHGWGSSVTTCAYGALQGSPLPETEWYTNTFNGTSSASPIVTGAVAVLQGMVKAAYGFPLDARLARDVLRQTGTPQSGTALIGPRPDLSLAWSLAASGIGRVAGTVTDAGLAPLPDVDVAVQETGAFDVTSAAGAYGFTLLPGTYQLDFDSFFYASLTAPATVVSGGTTPLNVVLSLRPTTSLTGRVYDTAGAPLGGARVTPLAVPVTGTASAGDGTFAIAGAPLGHVYALLFDGLPGRGAKVQTIDANPPAPPAPGAFAELPAATLTFEGSDGGLLPETALWQWGQPARAVGPAGGFSGLRCWAVGLTADYPDTQSSHLTSPVYDFSAAPALFLSFHYWSDTEPGFDGVNVQATADTVWTVVAPLSLYSDLSLGGLGHQPGWSGDSGGWRGAVFDLSAFRVASFRFRLAFGSDEGVQGHGFWVDDVTLDTGPVRVGVEPEAPPRPAGPALAAFPNPFNPVVTIAWSLPAPGPARLEVYDLRGRRVRALLAGEPVAAGGTVRWDGRDDAGRAAPSGVYLARLRTTGAEASCRLLLAK